ncbi:prolyl-tRNA synthetase associated domain-containing protein 1-like [Ptychodera flava]|uniref:prolyl-tRNA synthetase associated domain-containing protein 1-like n=1 Tax=Ptychodera flava TaxID=63121 RepID=UPI00396AA51A
MVPRSVLLRVSRSVVIRQYSKMSSAGEQNVAPIANDGAGEAPGASKDRKMAGKAEILAELEGRGFDICTVEHPEVFTVETMMPHLQDIKGIPAKNFFLKDKKKKRLWLLTTRFDREVNLAKVAKEVGGSGGFRFADESIMVEKIGVGQGCVTPLALYNDKDKDVRFLLDSDLVHGGHERVFSHPMVNSASTGIKPEDFVKFMESTGHTPILINFENL